jgi:siroheme synthase
MTSAQRGKVVVRLKQGEVMTKLSVIALDSDTKMRLIHDQVMPALSNHTQ